LLDEFGHVLRTIGNKKLRVNDIKHATEGRENITERHAKAVI
jgi:hypothetical protein